ncbi:MAG TPA: cysteine hydrolase [Candidatus Altiarchaeales archaeon]|nr:cysteine hydrolase [Candidatus Altiarchaeales archaeon]
MQENRALLVIDMLNDFLYGKLKCERCQKIIPDIRKLIDFCRDKEISVIYVCDSHTKDDLEFKKWPPHAVEGTKGAEIISELKPDNKDFIITKRKYSAFFQTGLDSLLRERDIKELILSGILTDICIQHTVADAFYRGYRTIVPKECTEALSDEDKENSFRAMQNLYNTRVVSLDNLIKKN